MSQDRLFTTFRLGGLELPNRTVMAPMTRNRATPEVLAANDLTAAYYAQRAGAGLIITEGTQVGPLGVGYPNTPGIHTDAQEAGWRAVTDAVHARGGRIVAQLWHVGRVSHPANLGGATPVGPSAIAAEGEIFTYEGMKPFVTPRALETDELPGLVTEFAEAARRAKAAGFDGVEVHAANGYLLQQFLEDGTNQRTDAYGGSPANRVRLLREVTAAVIEVWGAARVGVRLSPLNPFNSAHDSDPVATYGTALDVLRELNVGYVHLIVPAAPFVTAEGPADVLAWFRARVPNALIAAGGFDRERAEEVLRRGEADLIAFGRPFIANPDLPQRLRLRAPLNAADPSTFYGGDARGYIDYPALEQVA